MRFSNAITRAPLPYKAEIVDDLRSAFSGLSSPMLDLVANAGSCSPYLAGLISKEHALVRELEYGDAEVLLSRCIKATKAGSDLSADLRRAKGQVALLSALADLGGVWSLEEVTRTLTEFAEFALNSGLRPLLEREVSREKLPGLDEGDLETSCGYVILAMGKMGANELNYSSDIDLICLFDDSRFDPGDQMTARTSFVRVTRALMGLLSDVTGDGYVFRTDLRLRPDPSVTPVCISMSAAESYYESVGRAWERAAFLKARAAVGDVAAGEAFLDRLSPFVWRKHLDFAAIQDAHDMRLQIRDHKGGVQGLAGRDLKLGQGGIREIEFFTQTRQIIAGGRDTTLRVRGTVEGLQRLRDAAWVDGESASSLADNYRAYREIEHRLQMINDTQTHALPTSDDGFDRLARFCGEGDTDQFKSTLADRLCDVESRIEAFFVPEEEKATTSEADAYLEEWKSFPALRSDRASDLFRRLFPRILTRMKSGDNHKDALAVFEQFLKGLPAGVQVFSLFEANEQLLDLIVDICTLSPALAAYLGRNAQVFDAVIAGEFFTPWPAADGLTEDMTRQLAAITDYEARLDQARRWQKEWHFRVGVHLLRGLISSKTASGQYADLAEATIRGLLPFITDEIGRRHGFVAEAEVAVLGMGSLGLGRLSAGSDLDLIVIYNAPDEAVSSGPRELPARSYFARLTQALITAISAATAEGKLYEVDMRLRPSGQSGPVATSLNAFRTYQLQDAWVWEHLALTKARPLAGSSRIIRALKEARREVLTKPPDVSRVARETQEMRVRLQEAGRSEGPWDFSEGPGGRKDIELFAAASALIAADGSREVSDQLRAALDAGWLDRERFWVLMSGYALFLDLGHRLRFLTADIGNTSRLSAGAMQFLLTETGLKSVYELETELTRARDQVREIIDEALASPPEIGAAVAENER